LDIPRRIGVLLATPAPLDWIRVGLLAAGVLCVVTSLLPAAEAEQNMRRILPLLLFLASVIVLANLAREALVFDVIATRLAITGRGSYAALFLLCVAFASVTTILLNLDTTAVLITPVLLALAARAGIAALPLAMTTIWLANTASLLLPVSNLTNLLAADRIALAAPLSPRGCGHRKWPRSPRPCSSSGPSTGGAAGGAPTTTPRPLRSAWARPGSGPSSGSPAGPACSSWQRSRSSASRSASRPRPPPQSR
jgi:hypothetical protein